MAFWPVLAFAAACAQAPTGEQIAQALTDRAARDEASPFSALYQKEWTEEDLDEKEPLKKKIWILTGNGFRYSQTLIEEIGRQSVVGAPEEKNTDVRRAFVARYNFKAEPPCIISLMERKIWVVRFWPRTDVPLPEGENEDPLLNHLQGTMYIDAESGYVRNAFAELAQPFRVKLVGKVTRAKVYLDQDDEDGVVTLRHLSAEIWAESRIWPFDRKFYHLRRIYQIFRKPSETTPAISPLP